MAHSSKPAPYSTIIPPYRWLSIWVELYIFVIKRQYFPQRCRAWWGGARWGFRFAAGTPRAISLSDSPSVKGTVGYPLFLPASDASEPFLNLFGYQQFLRDESQPTAGRRSRHREDLKQKVFSSLIGLTRSMALSPAFEGGDGKRRSGSTLSLRPELRPRGKPQHLCQGVEGLTGQDK